MAKVDSSFSTKPAKCHNVCFKSLPSQLCERRFAADKMFNVKNTLAVNDDEVAPGNIIVFMITKTKYYFIYICKSACFYANAVHYSYKFINTSAQYYWSFIFMGWAHKKVSSYFLSGSLSWSCLWKKSRNRIIYYVTLQHWISWSSSYNEIF